MKKQIREDYNNDTATGFAWDFLQIKVMVIVNYHLGRFILASKLFRLIVALVN